MRKTTAHLSKQCHVSAHTEFHNELTSLSSPTARLLMSRAAGRMSTAVTLPLAPTRCAAAAASRPDPAPTSRNLHDNKACTDTCTQGPRKSIALLRLCKSLCRHTFACIAGGKRANKHTHTHTHVRVPVAFCELQCLQCCRVYCTHTTTQYTGDLVQHEYGYQWLL